MRNFLVKFITTFFGVGYLPFVPGTFGSLAALVVYYFVKEAPFLLLLVAAGLFMTGLLLGGAAEELFKRRDPPLVVIDEVAGMLVALAFVPYSLAAVVMGFLFFRLLDTLKPYPAARLQEAHGGFGIMTDDIVAGAYTNLILQIVVRLASLRIS